MYGSTMSDDKFNKEYKYNIRHSYGQEGKRANYPPKKYVTSLLPIPLFTSILGILIPTIIARSHIVPVLSHDDNDANVSQLPTNPNDQPTRNTRFTRMSIPSFLTRQPPIIPHLYLSSAFRPILPRAKGRNGPSQRESLSPGLYTGV